MLDVLKGKDNSHKVAKARRMNENEIGKIVVDASIQLHRALQPGLLEGAYEELMKHGITRTLNGALDEWLCALVPS